MWLASECAWVRGAHVKSQMRGMLRECFFKTHYLPIRQRGSQWQSGVSSLSAPPLIAVYMWRKKKRLEKIGIDAHMLRFWRRSRMRARRGALRGDRASGIFHGKHGHYRLPTMTVVRMQLHTTPTQHGWDGQPSADVSAIMRGMKSLSACGRACV